MKLDPDSPLGRFRSRPLPVVDPDRSCAEALRLMDEKGAHGVAVLEHGRLVGIVTHTDIRRRAPRELRPTANGEANVGECAALLDHVRVSGVMRLCPVVVHRESTLHDVMRTLADREVEILPLVENGAVIGAIEASDVLGAILECSTADEPEARRATS